MNRWPFRYDAAQVAVEAYYRAFLRCSAWFTLFDAASHMQRTMSEADRRDWYGMHNMGGVPYAHRSE